MSVVVSGAEQVPLSRLRHHPANPRRGDVDAIAESLTAHGQYRPVVAQRSTRYVLAGNHTVKAARRLGWESVAVTWLDVDDATAARILVADNRTGDLATYDDAALLALLRDLPDLDGTGFDQEDLDRLDGVFAGGPGGGTSTATPGERPQITLGRDIRVRVDADPFDTWVRDAKAGTSRRDAVTGLRAALDMPEPIEVTDAIEAGPPRPTAGIDTVAIDAVTPHPANARQGDVGAISVSLAEFGQYRPIVADRATRHILVGNHTWAAASALGWTEIAVCWVDVDDVEARKIIAVDNRTADLASYDDDALAALLTSLPSLDGTGFSGDDIDDLLATAAAGGQYRRPATSSRTACRIGPFSWKVEPGDWSAWLRRRADDGADTPAGQATWVMTRLAIPGDWHLEDTTA